MKVTSKATGGEWHQYIMDMLPSQISTKLPFLQSKQQSATQDQDESSDQQTSSSAKVQAQDQQNDALYLCPVTIGGQKLMLNFDSGSSDLWVMSTHLDNMTQLQVKASGHSIYNPATSKTAKPAPGQTWDIEYGDGSKASGDVVTDTLVIGSISVEGQAIECAQKLSPAFIDTAGDGLLGLAMGTISTSPHRSTTYTHNKADTSNQQTRSSPRK